VIAAPGSSAPTVILGFIGSNDGTRHLVSVRIAAMRVDDFCDTVYFQWRRSCPTAASWLLRLGQLYLTLLSSRFTSHCR